MLYGIIIISIITDRKVGFELKDRNLELLNQPIFLFNYYADSGISFYATI